MTRFIDYEALNEELQPDIEEFLTDFCPDLETRREGQELLMINPNRHDSDFGSFKINLDTGKWADFAEPDDDKAKGQGVVSLLTYLLQRRPRDVAGMVQRWLEDGAQPPNEKAREAQPPELLPTIAVAETRLPEDSIFSDAELKRLSEHAGTRGRVYVYRTLDGRPVQAVIRYNYRDGRKTFVQYSKHSAEGGPPKVVAKAHPVPRPVYGLEYLSQDALVLLVEGEKACEAARQLMPGWTVMTHSGGAMGVRKADWEPIAALASRVVIWADCDEAGIKCASDIHAILEKLRPELPIQLLNLPAFFERVGQFQGKPFQLEDWHAADAADVLSLNASTDQVAEWFEACLTDPTTQPAGEAPAEPTPNAAGEEVPPLKRYQRVYGGEVYSFYPGKVTQFKETQNSQKEVMVCSGMELAGSARDAASKDWSLIINVRQPDGNAQQLLLQTSRLSSPQDVLAELLSAGLKVGRQDLLLNLLRSANPGPHYLLVHDSGWCEGGDYVLGQEKVTHQSQEPIFSALPDTTVYSVQGTVEEWNAHVGRYCAGNSRLLLFVGAVLAAPLLRSLNVEGAGFHLVGPSSVGKTTAMKVAGSMIGNPAVLMTTWRSTANALETIAAGRNDGTLLLDELALCPPEQIDDVAYMLGNGQGKQRMGRTGALRSQRRWRIMLLSTGEITPEQHLASVGKRWRAGMEMRLASLLADPGAGHGLFECLHDKESGVELATHLGQATSQYQGAIFRAWGNALAADMAGPGFAGELAAQVEAAKVALYQGNEGQIHRVARIFAVLQVALQRAIRAGLLNVPEADARWAIEVCFQAWLAMRGGTGPAEDLAILRNVAGTLQRTHETHFATIVLGLGDNPEIQTFRRDSYGFILPGNATEEKVFAIPPATFDEEFCQGYSPKQVKDLLRREGYLIPGNDGGPTQTRRLPTSSHQPRRYVIVKADIMDAYPTGA